MRGPTDDFTPIETKLVAVARIAVPVDNCTDQPEFILRNNLRVAIALMQEDRPVNPPVLYFR